jgi:hypothetical protein
VSASEVSEEYSAEELEMIRLTAEFIGESDGGDEWPPVWLEWK